MLFNFFTSKSSADPKLFFHTDVHCHIMPGVDHGAEDVDESLELIAALRKWGIEQIILTSHVTETTFENNPETLAAGFETLSNSIRDTENPVRLAYSAEYRIDPLFMDQLAKGQIIPMPDNYLLVENSYIQEPLGLDRLLFDLKVKGFKVIMAHPERFPYYQESPKRFEELHTAGNLFQVNLLSLAGYFGKTAKKTAEWLAKNGMVDFLGTDVHHIRHVEAIDNYLRSSDYRKHIPLLEKTVKNDIFNF
ncbi:MAG: hypothetical protein K2M07_03045 [Muribaculaceae bacterium]|nr:hypothetical protein [Muribaculaceae bacterium]